MATAKKTAGPEVFRNGESEEKVYADAAAANGPWEDPLPLSDVAPPPFDTGRLPAWLAEWANAVAEATQTPPDLGAALALAVVAAALAGKFRIEVRPGWQEPINLFCVVALLPGERKSVVFKEAIGPVLLHEKQEVERTAQQIAAAASEHRVLELELKATETKAAKETDPNERAHLRHEAKRLAQELAAHVVPEAPQLLCDDVTPEKLEQLLGKQGGKMLQASAEGTVFEIAKGRYSETANFDVFLKGHSGDPLRTDRVNRERLAVDQPALTCALAVQPNVLQGLAEQTTMRGRGFLARFLYFIPTSKVGQRKTAAVAVPDNVKAEFQNNVLTLWTLPGAVVDGKPGAHIVHLSAEADRELQAFERWLEPQLAEGEDFSYLAGWANKLAGAIARIAGLLHMAGALTWQHAVSRETVLDAIAIGRDYLLPHAQAAFGVMGADSATDDAIALWASICRRVESSECSENGGPRFTRRDAHQWNRRRFKCSEDVEPALRVLEENNYIRLAVGSGAPGRGHKAPEYEVNPTALARARNGTPRSQRTHCTQSDAQTVDSEDSECSENATPHSGGAERGNA